MVGVALNFRVSSEDPEFDYSFMCRENRVIWDFTNTFEGNESRIGSQLVQAPSLSRLDRDLFIFLKLFPSEVHLAKKPRL